MDSTFTSDAFGSVKIKVRVTDSPQYRTGQDSVTDDDMCAIGETKLNYCRCI